MAACAGLFISAAFVFAADPAPSNSGGDASAASDEVVAPDMSKYDLDTVRVMAKQFFLALSDTQRQLVAIKADRDNAATERGKLAASLGQLEKENADLRRQVRDLHEKLALASRPAPPAPSAVSSPSPETPKTTPVLEAVASISDAPAITKLIREQKTDFRTLNATPVKLVGQYFDLLGWAELSDHTSAKVFEDRATPQKFLAFTNADGQRVYLSIPVQGNEVLFKLLNAKGKAALRVRIMGTSAKDDKPFEGAIQRWETLDTNPPGPGFTTPPPSSAKTK